MKYLQYALVIGSLLCLGAIVWAPLVWWKLILTALLMLIGSAAASNARTDVSRPVKR